MADIEKLKQKTISLKFQMDHTVGWFAKRKLRKQITSILCEIEYQEGRLQYANRPYSFPTILPHPLSGCKKGLSCKCGCWVETRRELIKM